VCLFWDFVSFSPLYPRWCSRILLAIIASRGIPFTNANASWKKQKSLVVMCMDEIMEAKFSSAGIEWLRLDDLEPTYSLMVESTLIFGLQTRGETVVRILPPYWGITKGPESRPDDIGHFRIVSTWWGELHVTLLPRTSLTPFDISRTRKLLSRTLSRCNPQPGHHRAGETPTSLQSCSL
jgi:hypothetical protein